MTQCPRCGSVHVSNNKLEAPVEKIAHGAHVLHRLGLPMVAIPTMVAAIGLKAVDHLRHAWSCNDCGTKFS